MTGSDPGQFRGSQPVRGVRPDPPLVVGRAPGPRPVWAVPDCTGPGHVALFEPEVPL